ncbi:MAG: HDOD domain-containing protein, partial [Planctomycetota bacterium]
MTKVPVAPLSLQERTRRELSQKSDLIPSLPEVVDQILSLTNDPTAELADFEKILQTDQGLVVKMLQVVNSPFYGLRSPATSIREAVMILGF